MFIKHVSGWTPEAQRPVSSSTVQRLANARRSGVGSGRRTDLNDGFLAKADRLQPDSFFTQAIEDAAATIAASARPSTRIGVYANAFLPEPPSEEPYAGISVLREDLGPDAYLAWCRSWTEAGASIIGGCCGIGREHIERLADHFGKVAARG